MQCQAFLGGAPISGICPTEYSNKCNTAAATGVPGDLCACVQDPSQTIDPNSPPTTFCAATSKICKANSNGAIGCNDCSDGECPKFAPRCAGGNNPSCVCGNDLPFATPGTFNTASTCSGNTDIDKFVCGKSGNPCDAASVNPFCLDESGLPTIDAETSSCQVNNQIFPKLTRQ